MTSEVIIAIIAGLPAFLAAMTGLIIGLRTSGKADKIHEAVNGNLDSITQELARVKSELQTLKGRRREDRYAG